jgi:hypothetical protein
MSVHKMRVYNPLMFHNQTQNILSWFRQQICHRGRCMAICGRGEHGGAIQDGGSTSLSSFRSRNSGETLRAAIIHYMATSARLQ